MLDTDLVAKDLLDVAVLAAWKSSLAVIATATVFGV